MPPDSCEYALQYPHHAGSRALSLAPSAWKHRTLCQKISGGKRRIATRAPEDTARLRYHSTVKVSVPHSFVTFSPTEPVYINPQRRSVLFCTFLAPAPKKATKTTIRSARGTPLDSGRFRQA